MKRSCPVSMQSPCLSERFTSNPDIIKLRLSFRKFTIFRCCPFLLSSLRLEIAENDAAYHERNSNDARLDANGPSVDIALAGRSHIGTCQMPCR